MTITVFTDLQCAGCDDYELQTVDPLIEEYARAGTARFEFRNFSLGQAETTKAAYAATAAGEQDREWQYVDLFFRNQDEAPAHTVSDEFLDDIGNAIPDFDLDAWREARDSARGRGPGRRRRHAGRRPRPAASGPRRRGQRPGRHQELTTRRRSRRSRAP